MEWITVIFNYGVPSALIGVGVLAARRFAEWCKPRAEKLVEAHLSLVDGLRTAVESQTAIMRQQSAAQKEHGELLREIHRHTVPHE